MTCFQHSFNEGINLKVRLVCMSLEKVCKWYGVRLGGGGEGWPWHGYGAKIQQAYVTVRMDWKESELGAEKAAYLRK